eukprot:CAMPEP_0175078320 /NCGR_PEP_ID=MMETSP0052_2-20121109/24031_1 /TAXON_ID=51329 ORGANISM="Polytomella parva, Strain SAG 63-3" /NCGR_SAMPLE_ID=MMETSP0052_2 /ASSEMBLY_ACC=CAM_ASM_000194 /LENGTH=95 /DNA_ID=CAMNT_0016348185 /DNA_START=32 /DNA_END=319 /DNA_ORIENTATION=+
MDAAKQQALEIEREQEKQLMAKYGGLKPKKKLLPKDHKFFDSADWALNKEANKGDKAVSPESETLPPRLEPIQATGARRATHLDTADKVASSTVI